MVHYSPLGDCIFNEVFVIDLGNGSVPDAFPPFLRYSTRIRLPHEKNWPIAAQRNEQNRAARYYENDNRKRENNKDISDLIRKIIYTYKSYNV